jgi:transcriptional antiterminator NusG
MWYVIHTFTGKEEECQLLCEDCVDKEEYQEIFIPRYITQKHFKKQWHEIEKVLFPGYLFIDTDRIEDVIKGLRVFYQYSKVLRDGEMISPVTPQEKEFLSNMMDDKHIVNYSEGFLIGEEVYITSGPLKNYKGYIKGVNRHRRIAKLEIPIFGRPTPIEVGFGAFARVTKQEFEQMVSDNISRQSATKKKPGQVKVLRGIFQGMTGKFLQADPERDEWTVEIDLFGVGTKVTFQRNEIEM